MCHGVGMAKKTDNPGRIHVACSPELSERIERAVAARNAGGAYPLVTRSDLVRELVEAGLAAEPKRGRK